MLIVWIILGVIAAILVITGAVFWLMRFMKQKEASDLRRYLQSEDCQWEQTGGQANGQTAYFINHAPEPQGIEMRVYNSSELSEESRDDEGVCLSIIDPANHNGMILNGFTLPLEAMQFGDGLWNDRFLGNTGIMEEMIQERRVSWHQEQQEIIIGHYALFM